MKIKWSFLLSRVKELELSEFSYTYTGRLVRKGVVVKAGVTKKRGVWVILEEGHSYVFPNPTTWALLSVGGTYLSLIRGVEPPYEHFTFCLQAPFVVPDKEAS